MKCIPSEEKRLEYRVDNSGGFRSGLLPTLCGSLLQLVLHSFSLSKDFLNDTRIRDTYLQTI